MPLHRPKFFDRQAVYSPVSVPVCTVPLDYKVRANVPLDVFERHAVSVNEHSSYHAYFNVAVTAFIHYDECAKASRLRCFDSWPKLFKCSAQLSCGRGTVGVVDQADTNLVSREPVRNSICADAASYPSNTR